MYKKQLLADAIIQGLFIVPLLILGLITLVNFMGYTIIWFMVALFLTGIVQMISALYWGVFKREHLRSRYLIFCFSYVGISILFFFLGFGYIGLGEDLIFFVWIIAVPIIAATWYWAMTIRDMQRPERFLTNNQPQYSDILDQ